MTRIFAVSFAVIDSLPEVKLCMKIYALDSSSTKHDLFFPNDITISNLDYMNYLQSFDLIVPDGIIGTFTFVVENVIAVVANPLDTI